eukprot:gene1371-2751_t
MPYPSNNNSCPDTLGRWRHKFGDIYVVMRPFSPVLQRPWGPVNLCPRMTVVLSGPGPIRKALTQSDNLVKPLAPPGIHREMLEHSCTQASGDRLRRQRRVILPLFGSDHLAVLYPQVVAAGKVLVHSILSNPTPRTHPPTLQEDVSYAASHAIIHAVLGPFPRSSSFLAAWLAFWGTLRDNNYGSRAQWNSVCVGKFAVWPSLASGGTGPHLTPHLTPHTCYLVFVPHMSKYLSTKIAPILRPPPLLVLVCPTVQELQQEMTLVLEDRLARPPGSPACLLDYLLAHTDPGQPVVAEGGAGLGWNELRDNLWSFLTAAFETAAGTLCNALLLLGKHTQYQDSARAEVVAQAGHNRAPSFAEVRAYRHLTNIVKETLRLYPPVLNRPRQATCPVAVPPHTLPAKMNVLCDIVALQRDPEIWQDPDQFTPERWNDASRKVPSGMCPARDGFMAFGLGQKSCTGQALAMLE